MSLQSLFSLTSQNENQILITGLSNEIDRLASAIRELKDFQPKPEIFLKSNNNNLSSNVNDGTVILPGIKIPPLHRGTVRDFNLNFTTTAGTVRIVILDQSGNIRIDVLRGINTSTNGVGETVLEEGESLAVVGQTAGAGTFSVYCSGTVQRVR